MTSTDLKPATIHFHDSTWDEPFKPSDDMFIFNAHRPIPGTYHWESKSRWGIHYAAVSTTDERYDYYVEQARVLDARQVILVNNAQAIELAEQRRLAKGSKYGLKEYLTAIADPYDAAAEFAHLNDAPWDKENDRTADDAVNTALAELHAPAAPKEAAPEFMEIQFTATIKVDAKGWARDYGITGADEIRDDVLLVLNQRLQELHQNITVTTEAELTTQVEGTGS